MHTNTMHKTVSRAIFYIVSLAEHTTLNIYKHLEISIERSAQHPSEGSNSERFNREKNALSRPAAPLHSAFWNLSLRGKLLLGSKGEGDANVGYLF